jgi:hypothetical protein
VGLQPERHITSDNVVDQALVWDDVLIHPSAFALEA